MYKYLNLINAQNKCHKKLLIAVLIIIIINVCEKYFYYLSHKNVQDIKVCLCVIGKKENLYVKEFIEHQKNIGYNHIYIYDNNNINDEKFEDVISDAIIGNFVTIYNVRGLKNHQVKSYKDCYEKNNKQYDWLSFFDFDEFLYIKHNKSIQEFLNDEKFKRCKNVKINWLYYTDNDLIYYENISLKERFTSYKLDYEANRHIKSTVRGNLSRNYWAKLGTPHSSPLRYYCCDTFGKRISHSTPFNIPNYEYAYIKHYWTKTLEEFCIKIKRGRADIEVIFDNDYWNLRFQQFFALNNKTNEKINYIKKNFNIDI